MSGRLRQLAVFLTVAIGAAFPQSSAKPADSKPDYSKEAFVIEQDVSKITFESDGTGTRESSSRIHIQSDAGVQRYSVLTSGAAWNPWVLRLYRVLFRDALPARRTFRGLTSRTHATTAW